jgi:hypothetical protein
VSRSIKIADSAFSAKLGAFFSAPNADGDKVETPNKKRVVSLHVNLHS